jgi:hypothetical protein
MTWYTYGRYLLVSIYLQPFKPLTLTYAATTPRRSLLQRDHHPPKSLRTNSNPPHLRPPRFLVENILGRARAHVVQRDLLLHRHLSFHLHLRSGR